MSGSQGGLEYKVVEGWGQGAGGRVFGGVTPAVATDSSDRVYIARRDPPAILVYGSEGDFLTSLGDDLFKNPHSVWFNDQDQMYVADVDDHTVRKLDTDGRVLQTLGTPDAVGAPGQPFNRPTWAVEGQGGDIYVSDGYGQFRVHRFSADGTLLQSWGEEGTGPGQFALPHGLRVDSRGRVLVLDRENRRMQIFDAEGTYIDEWPDLDGPNDLYIDSDDKVYMAEGNYRISVFDLDGELLARWGEQGEAPGQFANGPHGLWLDSQGDLYVAEVPFLDNRLQKFTQV
ncbi:MAG: peptidyl-alpha-hydroxyglycine alpha-amidating lyase family protein [Caldilineaceae bacterium]|nr:peptidyl-alpha-hydroxyglycine alpha-amidating lyase family protein [Caldilineaceae bacterium]